jgi:hypothetical protein
LDRRTGQSKVKVDLQLVNSAGKVLPFDKWEYEKSWIRVIASHAKPVPRATCIECWALNNPTAVIVSSAGLFDCEVMEVAMDEDVCIFY